MDETLLDLLAEVETMKKDWYARGKAEGSDQLIHWAEAADLIATRINDRIIETAAS